ncbi:MAG: hypothetical protein GY832_11195 [Chloroflexi bacterium]|nr:hypothetical protein [Chloroflexota bacterium]
MTDHIILSNSDSTLVKKFRVLSAGYSPVRSKIGARRVTVTGKWDNQVGPILRSWKYVLLVFAADPTDPAGTDLDTEGYGTLAHIKTFFDYQDPVNDPTNVITYTDYDSVAHPVYLVGQLSEQNLSPQIIGGCTVFQVPIEMQRTEP